MIPIYLMDVDDDTTTTTTTTPSLDPALEEYLTREQDDGEVVSDERPWSFRRFEADKQATVARDAWNFLQQETNPLLTAICDSHRDFYRAEQLASQGFAQVFPSPSDHKGGTDTPAPSDGTRARNVMPRAEAHKTRTEVHTSAAILLKRLHDLQVKTTTTDRIQFSMTRQELDELTNQLQKFVEGSRQLISHCQAAITMIGHAKQHYGRQNEQIREFIATLWSDHAQQLRAYPPFWDLGPLDAPLYGMGRAEPPPGGPASAPPNPAPRVARRPDVAADVTGTPMQE